MPETSLGTSITPTPPRFHKLTCAIVCLVTFAIGVSLILIFYHETPARINLSTFALIGSILVGTAGYGIFVAFRANSYERSEQEQLFRHQLKILDGDPVRNLLSINFRYLEKYYRNTHDQASKSFTMSTVAAILGFILIVGGIGLAILNNDNHYLALMTSASGVITQFISAIFFYLHNKTVIKMAEYHQKLILTQNVSLALTVLESMEGVEKKDAQKEIVKSLTADVNKLLVSSPSNEKDKP